MKRITLLLVSLLTLFSLGSKADPGDPIPIEIAKETDPEEIPRSSTPEVEAYYLVSSGLLEVQFNANLGGVTISVTDASGLCVYSTWVDTSLVGSAVFGAPAAPGCYTLGISGVNYSGSGSFYVM